jgi:hypothetical protein
MKLNDYMEQLKLMGIRHEDFAKRCKIHPVSLYKYRNGATPHPFVARKIVKGSNGQVTLHDLGISE